MTPEAGSTTGAEQTAAASPELQEAVTQADNIAAISRNKRRTTLALLTATPEEKETVTNFFAKIKLQADSEKQIYALSVAAARKRNEGKSVPPSKQKKAKAAETK